MAGTIQPGTVVDADLAGTADIKATKVRMRRRVQYFQVDGADVAAQTAVVGYVYGADATVIAVTVVPNTAPTGGDKAFTVDVKKGNSGAAYATILSGVVTVNSSSADRTPQTASLSTTTLSAGDSLQVVVAVSGSTGSQGQGVLVEILADEKPAP